MSANVEFNITAFDETSGVFSTVRSNVAKCFTSVETGATETADRVSSSSRQIQTSAKLFLLVYNRTLKFPLTLPPSLSLSICFPSKEQKNS